MDITIRVDFPALDRLCGILEGKTGAGLCAEVKVDVGGSVDVCAEKVEAAPSVEGTEPKAETKSETRSKSKAKAEPKREAKAEVASAVTTEVAPEPTPAPEPVPEPAPKPAPEPEPAPAEKTYVLEDLQRAAASLRDQGKLGAVTALFPEYGIRKLSDLKAEQMAGFAGELKRLGAEL